MLFFTHCKEEPTQPLVQAKTTVDKKNTSSQNDSTQISKVVKVDSLKTKDKGIIVPDAVICGTLDLTLWEFDHYQANPGKRVGILPKEDIFINYPTIIRMFKDTLGYNYINCSSGYIPVARLQTYSDSNIMMGGLVLTDIPGANTAINTYPGLYAAYFDEPVGGDAPYIVPCAAAGTILQHFRQYMNANGSANTLLVVGDVTTSEVDCIAPSVSNVMCTRYFNDALHLFPDQRPLWSAFKTSYQSKFDDSWISATSDIGEYDQLLGHAANLGLNGVWFYQREDVALQNGAMNRIKEFSFLLGNGVS